MVALLFEALCIVLVVNDFFSLKTECGQPIKAKDSENTTQGEGCCPERTGM